AVLYAAIVLSIFYYSYWFFYVLCTVTGMMLLFNITISVWKVYCDPYRMVGIAIAICYFLAFLLQHIYLFTVFSILMVYIIVRSPEKTVQTAKKPLVLYIIYQWEFDVLLHLLPLYLKTIG
ncbi:MAG: hypothetical protein ACPGED_08155, partial [Flavobacteriales bacterium]